MRTFIVLFLAALLCAGCSRGARVTVVNASGAELKNVVASGSGFSVSIGTIAPGDERRVYVQPAGESGLRLAFDANGKQFTSVPDVYLESSSNYKVKATVAPDFSVTMQDEN